MGMIDNDWLPALRPEFAKPYYKDLFDFVKAEYSRVVVYPPADEIFNAFHFTPLSKVKVVVLGLSCSFTAFITASVKCSHPLF